jgi:hypothetical protein
MDPHWERGLGTQPSHYPARFSHNHLSLDLLNEKSPFYKDNELANTI